MQLREKPLVYPRYPERQTLHHHSSGVKSEAVHPCSSLAGSNAGAGNEISSVNCVPTIRWWRNDGTWNSLLVSRGRRPYCHLSLGGRQIPCRRPANTLLLPSNQLPWICRPLCYCPSVSSRQLARQNCGGSEALRQTRRKHTGPARDRGKQRRIIVTAGELVNLQLSDMARQSEYRRPRQGTSQWGSSGWGQEEKHKLFKRHMDMSQPFGMLHHCAVGLNCCYTSRLLTPPR